MSAAWPTSPSIAAICACVASIMKSQSQPIHGRAQSRARERVEGRERRLAVGDRVSAKLGLEEDFDDTAQDDQPEEEKSLLGPEPRRRDQLARADDRPGENQPGADLPERREERT